MLSTPQAVLKELIENSLDAGATSIHIETDPTTIGLLSVRDNGSGIPPTDRPLLAVRSTTSKIRHYEDIFASAKEQDGIVKSLGFKGEALSCIADLAESPPNLKMNVVSRTQNESVASSWSVGRDGTAIMP